MKSLFPRAFVASAALLVSIPVSTALAVTNLGNIMPLGDSITDGAGASGGYRAPLYTDLTGAGFTFTFVGSATDNPGTLPLSEQHHEGHSGYVIQSRDPSDPNPGGSGRPGIADNIAAWIGAGGVNPNIILLMIGTNDVDLNYFPAGAQSRLSNLVSQISNKSTGLRPNADLILAEITPIGNAAEDVQVQAFNSEVAAVVAQHDALGEKVSLVDMHSALNPSTDLNDKLHPNASGYQKMATVWLNGIEAVAAPEPSTGILCAGASLLGAIGFRRRRVR